MNMVSTIGHKAHAQKKRILAHIYSKSYLQSSAQIESINRILLFGRILPLIDFHASSGQPCDVFELSGAVGMDFTTAYVFGISRSTNFIQNFELRRKYLQAYNCRRPWQPLATDIHPLFESVLNKIGTSMFPKSIHEATVLVEDFALELCKSTDRYLKQNPNHASIAKVDNQYDQPVVFKQFKEGLTKLRKQDPAAGREDHPYLTKNAQFIDEKEFDGIAMVDAMTILEVYSEMGDHVAAGHDTTSITMTYLFHELCKHPEVQDKLATELRTLSHPIKWPSETGAFPSAKELDNLPNLNAVILETLRLRSPTPGPLPRVSPPVPGGSSLGPPNTKHHDTGIPAGVRVSALSYALHRLQDVFHEADKFKPSRWLNAAQGGSTSQDQLAEVNRHFWAFGSGGRMCIGSHFALQEIKLLVSAIYGKYRTEVVDDEGIEQVDSFLTYPKGGKLIIRFVER